MATIEEAVVARMAGYAGLTALIGAGANMRLFPLTIPQTATLPAVAYQKISSPKEQAQDGSSHLARSRLQFTCEADLYSEVKAVATQVKNCWDSFAGTITISSSDSLYVGGCEIANDSDTAREREATATPVVRIDVLIWHYE